ncbi:somatostatin-1 isoform X1 [Hippoglossus hippoglossus]|uniref:somatostatin-1 isoform X1 n=2 Tax=Hippoglossus hippoglossus TaxID=8267 RepID=UPI00148E376E|nr:somatostatin-1 isoform X1 [Hippoglossus hippoglossus]
MGKLGPGKEQVLSSVRRRNVKMLRSQVQVILVALLSSVLLVSGAPRRDMQTRRPREELTNDKALAHLLLLQFVSELMATRVEQMLPKLEEEEEEEGATGGRVEVMRRHLPLSQRERKAGCRNFFWKTFTSC